MLLGQDLYAAYGKEWNRFIDLLRCFIHVMLSGSSPRLSAPSL